MDTDESFYAELPRFHRFEELTNQSNYRPLPDSWHIVITDVQGSTKAIEAGRYKDVNTLGAATIMAVVNAVKPMRIPYVFGGDGATLCIPAVAVDSVREALVATQELARVQFNLSLRIGIIPVVEVTQANYRVLIAKFHASDGYHQAIFKGGGLGYADALLKDATRGAPFRLETTSRKAHGDFSGFECRWQNIPSPHGQTVSLLVQAKSGDLEKDALIYKEILTSIGEIYGEAEEFHPIRSENMVLGMTPESLRNEISVRTGMKGTLFHWLYTAWVMLQVRVGRLLMKYGVRAAGTDWGGYKDTLVRNSDFRKFDDMLRMILAGTENQRGRLEEYLEVLHQAGQVDYGMHEAASATLTCIIFGYDQDHVHFVDGSDGGYALAAKALKRRTASSTPQATS